MVPPTPPGETTPGAVAVGTPDAFCGQPGAAGAGGGGGGGGGGGTAPVFSVGGTAWATWADSRDVGGDDVCRVMTPARSISTAAGAGAAGANAVSTPPSERASADAPAIAQISLRLTAT